MLDRVQTDTQTHKTSTVTLAAHARRGLTSNKTLILDVGMEKEQKQELGWNGGYLYYPFLHSTVYYVHVTHKITQCKNG